MIELDRVPLWRRNHVSIRQLVEDFARYLYLPRLKDSEVLLNAIREGFTLLTWEQDAFAYAAVFDEEKGRYQGLRCGQQVSIADSDAAGLLVKPEVALRQLAEEAGEQLPPPGEGTTETPDSGTGETTPPGPGLPPVPPVGPTPLPQPKRFYGSVELDSTRVGRDASRIAEEVIVHLQGLVGARVKVTMEIEAEIPGGAPEQVVRAVTENSNALNFKAHGFERE